MLKPKAAHRKDITTGLADMQHRHFATIATIIREMPADASRGDFRRSALRDKPELRSRSLPARLRWRLEDAKGHLRRFATPEAAYRAALRTNVIAEVHRYARSRADFLRSYAAAGERAWADANRYAGVRASLWGADPMGLFTADLPPLPRRF